MGWLSGWSYRKSHEIDGSTAGAQTNYQVKIRVHYGSGSDSGEHIYSGSKCKTDFGDIRVTKADGQTLLDHWIEKKVNGDYADIWIEVDSIPASPDSATTYIYYGNSGATTTSDIDAAFPILSDDFEDGILGNTPTGWTQESGNVVVADDRVYEGSKSLKLHPTEAYGSYNLGADHSGIRVVGFFQHDKAGRWWPRVKDSDDTVGMNVLCRDDVNDWRYRAPSGWNTITGVDPPTTDVWYRLEYLCRVSDDKFRIKTTASSSWSSWLVFQYALSGLRKVWFGTRSTTSAEPVWIDNLVVGKYVDPEPSHGIWGSEEEPGETIIDVTDTFSLGDSIIGDKSLLISDGLFLSETSFKNWMPEVIDYIGLSEALLRDKLLDLIDAVGLSGFLTTPTRNIETVDAVGLSEIQFIEKTLLIVDLIDLAEELIANKLLYLTDPINITDNPLKDWSLLITEDLTLSDAAYRDKLLLISDTLRLSDFSFLNILLLLSDSVDISDTTIIHKQLFLSDFLSSSDTILNHKLLELIDVTTLGEIIVTPTRSIVTIEIISLAEFLAFWKPRIILQQGSLQLPLEYVTSVPYTIPTLLVEHDTPGVDGGLLQHMGFDSESLQIDGFFKGIYAQNDLSILEQMSYEGDPVNVKIYDNAGETFVSAYYFIDLLEWQPDNGRPSSEGAVKILFRISLKRKVI